MQIEQAVDTFLAGDKSNCVAIWKQLVIELEVDEDNALAQASRVSINSSCAVSDIAPMIRCLFPALIRRGLLPSSYKTMSDEELAERIERYKENLDAEQD